MSKKLQKLFSTFPYLFSNLLRKRWSKLSMYRKALLAYPLLIFIGGAFQSPSLALVVGSVYMMGFYGLVLFYTSRHKEGQLKWLYMILGAVLIFLMQIWLELLYKFVPYG